MGDVGCLSTTPNPAWYWMRIANSGSIRIHMTSSDGTYGHDVDFICWGPFASLQAACATNLMSNSGVDCSYSTAAEEDCDIPNAVSGQIYVLLITNYANAVTNISFDQTSGSGSTDCAIIRPFIGDTVCVGQTAVLTVDNPVAGATYTFEGPNNFYQNGSSTTVTIPNAQLSHAGIYTMVLHPPTGQTGAPVSATLIVNPLPTVTATATDVCPGQNSTITGAGASTYSWSTGNTGNPITVSPIATTTYTVTGTSAQGCTNTATVTVNVYENPIITVSPSMICSGQQAIASSPTGVTYHWCCSMGDTAIINPIIDSTTIYTITVTDTHGCFSVDTVVVNPDAIIEATGDEICIGELAHVSATGGVNYIWSNGMQTATISVNPTFTTIYQVTGTNQYGCSGTSSSTVTVYPKPIADFTVPSDVVTLDAPELNPTDHSTGATSWYWNFGDVISSTNTSIVQNPTHTYTAVGKYDVWLIVTSEHGCMDSTSMVIQVESPYSFYIPSAFTPDKDGLNEVFKPVGRGLNPNEYTMMIFDRWGRLVFKTNTPYAAWDGYVSVGVRAPHGVYAYRFFVRDLEGKRHEYSGHFSLIR